MSLKLERIHHVAVICSDYQRSKDFYTRILGFNIIRETFREERDSWKLDLELSDGSSIELFSFPLSPTRLTRPEALGLRHLAFAVKNLSEAVSELKNHGIEVEVIRRDELTGKDFTFFQDPDGLPLEIYEA